MRWQSEDGNHNGSAPAIRKTYFENGMFCFVAVWFLGPQNHPNQNHPNHLKSSKNHPNQNENHPNQKKSACGGLS